MISFARLEKARAQALKRGHSFRRADNEARSSRCLKTPRPVPGERRQPRVLAAIVLSTAIFRMASMPEFNERDAVRCRSEAR